MHSFTWKRKREADSAKNVTADATEVVQLQCEEETKGLLKTTYFIAENKLTNSKFGHLVKFMKDMECPFKKLNTDTSSYGSCLLTERSVNTKVMNCISYTPLL